VEGKRPEEEVGALKEVEVDERDDAVGTTALVDVSVRLGTTLELFPLVSLQLVSPKCSASSRFPSGFGWPVRRAMP
jgi:hypothetical protein